MELKMARVMKKYMILAAVAAAVLAAGCTKETIVQPEQGTVLKASLSSLTKTAINGVKVSWTEGDAINVNGSTSYPVTEAAATATFEFKSALTAPYNAVYPPSIYKDATTVTLPSTWDINAFQVPLGGYLESGDAIPFKALTAFLKLSITGETTTTVKDITLKGLGGEQLCGDYAIDFKTLALTGSSSADVDKAVKINVNQALSATPIIVYIPIPAGEYTSGYQVDILDTEGGLMRKSVSARTVKAGELREMEALAFAVNVSEDPNIGGIPDAKEFKDFAAAVNDGRSISRWLNNAGEVELLADIDLGGEEWIPVGNASVTTSHEITGNAFTGVFNGKNHKVDNFTVTVPASAANTAAGLFGAISEASVKDLVIGENVVIKNSSNSGFVTMGAAVGFASESTLENIDSYAKMVNDAGKNSTRLVIGGAIGTLFSSETKASTAKDIKGHASFNVVNDINTANGATGFIVGGVIGYTDGKNVDSVPTKIENVVNYSDFSVQATRTAGVIGTMNSFTLAEGCANYGNISCTDVKATNSRVAGIVSAMGNSTALKNCVNYGDVAFAVSGDTTHGYAGGVAGQVNDTHSFTYFDGCASYGAVQSDRWFASGDDKYMGIICANFNSKVVLVKDCILGGKIGPYTPTDTDPVITITSENFTQYYSLTAASRIAKVTFEGNTCGTYSAPGIKTAQDLKDFAAAVNAGGDISAWADASGAVALLADIDLGGEEWIPIGNAAVNTSHAITGAAFTGVFDGKNHKVDNFKVTIPATDGGSVAGLFGVIDKATVKNLVIGDKVELKTSSTAFVTMGGAVAFASESTLENIDSYAKLIADGGKDNIRLVIGGTLGTLFSSAEAATTAKDIKGHASFDVVNNVNTKNGATGFIVGGTIGFMDGKDMVNAPTKAENVVNYSSFSVQATRTAGVIGTMNTNCIAEDCVNNGNISCTDVKASNSRVAGIVSAMGNNTGIKNCINYGDISFAVSGDSSHGYVAGIAGQTNDANSYVSYIEGCATYGAIQSDIWFGSEKFMGIVCASFNTKKITVKNCIIGGKIGPFTPTDTDPVVTITADNFEQYYSLSNATRIANVVFEGNSFGTRP